MRMVEGVLHLPVRVKPRAAQTRVLGFKQGYVEVAVAAPPADGAANRELVRVLARRLGVARSRLSLIGGLRSKIKCIAVQGVSEEDARRLLSQ